MSPKLNHLRRWLTREKRVKWAWCFCIVVFLVIFIDSFGVVRLYYERDFSTEFKFPLETDNFSDLVRKFRNGDPVEHRPINQKYSSPKYIRTAKSGCPGPYDLLILVKSAPTYFENRAAIRSTWGDPNYLQTLSNTLLEKDPSEHSEEPLKSELASPVSPLSTLTTVIPTHRNPSSESGKMVNDNVKSGQGSSVATRPLSVKLVFLLGVVKQQLSKKAQKMLDEEMTQYDDIVQLDFIDSYENNTIKAMVALRWAVEICSNFKYASLIDDDMYISVKNLVRFIENPTGYPSKQNVHTSHAANLHNTITNSNVEEIESSSQSEPKTVKEKPLESEEVKLYGGRVLIVRPKRYKSSKWYLPLEEYPYNYFPPYVPAAAVIMSKATLFDFYYASFFTHHFRFDDVFLGILAYKMNIRPVNSNFFHVCHDVGGKCTSDVEEPENYTQKPVSESSNHDHVIAMHGLSSADALREYWNFQKDMGNI